MGISPTGLPGDSVTPPAAARPRVTAPAHAQAATPATAISSPSTRTIEVALPDLMPGHLQLDIDRDTGKVIGRIVDKHTGALIAQVPSQEALRLAAAFKQDIGRIFYRKV